MDGSEGGNRLIIQRVDAEPLERLINQADILPWFVDEQIEKYSLPDDARAVYLLCANSDTVGGFIAAPLNKCLYHVHVAFMKGFREHSVKAGMLALEWLFSHTFCETAVALVPSDNKMAVAYAKLIGMKRCGKIERGIYRNGKHADFIIFEAHKWQYQQQ